MQRVIKNEGFAPLQTCRVGMAKRITLHGTSTGVKLCARETRSHGMGFGYLDRVLPFVIPA